MLKILTEVDFWLRVKVGNKDECWEWTGPKSAGYGRFSLLGEISAHRVSYTLHSGVAIKKTKIFEEKIYVLHKCNNKLCVNPSHLYLGSPRENSRDYLMDKARLLQDRLKNNH